VHISKIDEIIVTNITYNETIKPKTVSILLQWRTRGLRSFEHPEYEISIEIWQREWVAHPASSIRLKNSEPTDHVKESAIQTHNIDLEPFLGTSPRVQVHILPLVKDYKGISASRIVEILHNP
ncbi:hypothetical protein V3C99_005410, partial [Haemonchus contortus]